MKPKINSNPSFVPDKEIEQALLDELYKEGRPIKTGTLVERTIGHFPDRLTPIELQRTTPSGSPWWPGDCRFILNKLKKCGYARRVSKGYWEITNDGIKRIVSEEGYYHIKATTAFVYCG